VRPGTSSDLIQAKKINGKGIPCFRPTPLSEADRRKVALVVLEGAGKVGYATSTQTAAKNHHKTPSSHNNLPIEIETTTTVLTKPHQTQLF
jgi:hypothetical protein